MPQLSTIEPGNDARAEAVVDLLTSRLRHRGDPLERRVVMHPATLIERESTAGPAAGAPPP